MPSRAKKLDRAVSQAAVDPEGAGQPVPDRSDDRGSDQRGGACIQAGADRGVAERRTQSPPGLPPGAEKPEAATNHRNGGTSKTVLTGDGKLRIETPRDRDGSFEPMCCPSTPAVSPLSTTASWRCMRVA